ncbi:MAG: methyltransferase [Myxococcota bacterium]
MNQLDARGLFSLLFHGDKAIDVIETAWKTGLLRRLDAGPVTLGVLARDLEMQPHRLFKFLDCLESLGLVVREQESDAIEDVRFISAEPLEEAAELALGPQSIERDRNAQPWRRLHGHIAEVLRGSDGVRPDEFAWPPATFAQHQRFEESMAAGVAPIVASFLEAPELWGDARRVLDVGGGDGTLACALADALPAHSFDVFNLPQVEPLVRAKIAGKERLGFVAGDFLEEALPEGYDALSFVRVLHDWPDATSRQLLESAYAAIPKGGRVIVSEEMRTPARLAVQFFWSYFLLGVDACGSRLREVEWYRRTLREVGFREVTVHEGPFDIVVAVR